MRGHELTVGAAATSCIRICCVTSSNSGIGLRFVLFSHRLRRISAFTDLIGHDLPRLVHGCVHIRVETHLAAAQLHILLSVAAALA